MLEVSTTKALSSTADPIRRADPVGLSLTFLTGVDGGLIRGSKFPCPSTYEIATRNLLPTWISLGVNDWLVAPLMLVHFLLSDEICHCTLTEPIPSESVTDDKSIINGTSSIAAKPAVSTFSSFLSFLLTVEFFDILFLLLDDNFFCLSTNNLL